MAYPYKGTIYFSDSRREIALRHTPGAFWGGNKSKKTEENSNNINKRIEKNKKK